MSKFKNALARHAEIDRCLQGKKSYPSLKYLSERCSRKIGVSVSESTIDKDIRFMKLPKDKNGYEAPIKYSHKNHGYYYSELGFSIKGLRLNEQDWDALQYASRLLFQHREVPILANFKTAIEKINTQMELGMELDDPTQLKYIQFEKSVSSSGQEHIETIFPAIKNRFLLTITYSNIYKKTTGEYELTPFLLKEHRNRWYVTGWVEERNDFLTFALDRIQQIKLTEIQQPPKSKFDPEKFYTDSIGIIESDEEPVVIKLQIAHPFSKLIQLEPIHASQQLIKETRNKIEVSVKVKIDEELCLRILGMGPHCKVVSPATLKNKIGAMVAEMNRLYR